MSTQITRPPDAGAINAPPDGLSSSQNETEVLTLAALSVGSRLILRCRKDWRVACVSLIEPDHVTLSVGSPSGHNYRIRRPSDSTMTLDGSLSILGEGQWRAGFARYDSRW